jgi:basic membrane lipoprotein Med (substrate-binding protein (PBP1-ABC) superfamily)
MKQAQLKSWIGLTLLVTIGLIVTACGPAPTPQVIRETVEVPVEVEVQVTQEVEVETIVTATPAPAEIPQVAIIFSGKAQDQSFNQFMFEDAQALADQGLLEVSFAEDVTPADF